MSLLRCRFCFSELRHTFVDLGMTPLANSFVKIEDADRSEVFFPLHVRVCAECFLVQLPEIESPENIFSDYLYFSSYSNSWLEHAERYTDMATERFGLNPSSHIVEVAGNDGYLLQYFKQMGFQVLNVEPAANVAKAAVEKGIPSVVKFFGVSTARELAEDGGRADLIVANNVLAHVPNVNDFVKGFSVLLKPDGVATLEFPHLLNLIENNQFDTIYHEHFSYLSLTTVIRIFKANGLEVFDVEQLPTHGGSLRVFTQSRETDIHPRSARVCQMLELEEQKGLTDISALTSFGEKVKRTKRDLVEKLIELKNAGKRIVGYGAAAKGNTLLNYCGVASDFIDFVSDANPNKQNHLLPGTRIPTQAPDKIRESRPDYLLILPWNISDEIIEKNAFIREWGGKFILPIPEVRVVE
jgi:SAM-dependent methyltransferase